MNGESTAPVALAGGGDVVIDCAEAARLLGVSETALLSWSELLSFPSIVGGAGIPRFRRREIVALRDALPTAHSVSAAIAVARRRTR